VRFDITDAISRDTGVALRPRDDLRLTQIARCRVTHFGGTVIVERETFDDGVNVVTIAHGVVQALEQHGTGPVAKHRAAGGRVEGATMAVDGFNAARF